MPFEFDDLNDIHMRDLYETRLPPRERPSIEEFINARVEGLERMTTGMYSFAQEEILRLIAAIRETVELHKDWPVLLEEGDAIVYQKDSDMFMNPNEIKYIVEKKVEWITRKAYVERFGENAPDTPMLKAIARVWSSHPDFNPEWSE